MDYESWERTVPQEITQDVLWRVQAYRLSLFVVDLAWHDVTKLMRDRRTHDLASQLYRAAGSIEANISEGYSRSSGKESAHFYEYAFGSGRETRGWYYKGRHVLGEHVVTHRIRLVTQIGRLLITMIRDQLLCGPLLREDTVVYHGATDEIDSASLPASNALLLQDIPMT
jgi:four helix bundle protein